MQAAVKIQDDRVKDAKKRLDTAETRISQIKRELASIDGELAKYKGEEETAGQRIRMAQENVAGQDAEQRVDPGRVLPTFETARAEFRQNPTAERLAEVQQRCSQLYSAMFSADVTKPKVAGIDCDPKQATEAAATLFTLQAGTKAFNANCVGGDKLAAQRSTDALFGFAVKCLSDSGLPSRQTDELRTKISFAEMNRDDKAHRFVVSWNAFQDGNRLAYLALAIAIGIDSLIFMTGLFGANAVRSPLADVPSSKGRNSAQLEAIVENALLPDTLDNARATLNAMRPITNASGFMAEVRPEHARSAHRAAGAGRAQRRLDHQRRRLRRDRRPLPRARRAVRVPVDRRQALVRSRQGQHRSRRAGEDRRRGAAARHQPERRERCCTTCTRSTRIAASPPRSTSPKCSRSTNAPCARRSMPVPRWDACSARGKSANEFWIHRDLYKTLARIRARTLMADYGRPRIASGQQQGERFGGSITERAKAIEHKPAIEEATTTEIRTGFVTQLLVGAQHRRAELGASVRRTRTSAAIAANEAFTRTRRSNARSTASCASTRTMPACRSTRSTPLLKNRLKPQAVLGSADAR